MTNGKGDRNRSFSQEYRNGYERIFRRVWRVKQSIEDVVCSLDGEGLRKAIEKTRVESEEYWEKRRQEVDKG